MLNHQNQLSPQDCLQKVITWFSGYLRRFETGDPTVQRNIDLKAEHTRRVCEAIRDIGGSLGLAPTDLCLAEISAWLHDIGRFQQYKQYGTFADSRSENHALLGARVIRDHHVLGGLDPAWADMIVRVVECHNLASLPETETESVLFYLKLLRDADKVDIWRVVTEYYCERGNSRNQAIELDLPDIDRISAPVFEALMNGNVVRMRDLRTLQDFKLLQIGWIYDLNFPRTFQIALERKYLEAIRKALPGNSLPVKKVYERARAFLERNAAVV